MSSDDRRPGFVRLGVLSCAAIAALTVFGRLPYVVAKLDRATSRSESFTYEDREFAAGNSIVPNKRLLYEAKALIPPDGTFRVVTGVRPIKDASTLTREFASTFATYFLMPRRPSDEALWILCLGCDPNEVAPGARTVWSDGSGSSLLNAGK